MYSGFGRLVIASERKKTFQFVTHVQEVFIHSLPLLLLTLQNCKSETVNYTNLSIAAISLPIISMTLTALEVAILQCYENKGINLELRVKLRSHTRLTDLFRVAGLSIVCCAVTFVLGIYAFPS